MRAMWVFLAALVMVGCVGCATGAASESDSPVLVTATVTDVPAEQLAIMEAVFRHQALRNASGQQGAGVIFLAVGPRQQATDPPDALMQRMTGFKRLSESSGVDIGGVKDLQTGKPGYILYVETISMVDANTASVTGGYYEGGLSSSGNTYTVEKDAGSWRVVDDVMHWIS